MSKTPRKRIRFDDLFEEISKNNVIRTKNGSLRFFLDNNNNNSTDISIDDFNNFYMKDFKNKITDLEDKISRTNLSLDRKFFDTLRVLSSPVLKDTRVPTELQGLYETLNSALSLPDANRNNFERSFKDYLRNSDTLPGFMEALLYRNIKEEYRPSIFPHEIPSFSIIEDYGTKFTGEDILYLSEFALLATSDIRYAKLPIMMLKYPSLYIQDKNAEDYVKPVSCKELLDFYSPENHPGIIYQLMKSAQIDQDFSTFYEQMLSVCSEDDKKNYYNSLIGEIRNSASTEDDFSKDLNEYSDLGIIPADIQKPPYNETSNPLDKIIETAKNNPTEKNECLNSLSDEYIFRHLRNTNASLETIMYLFLHYDKITIAQLKQLLKEKQVTETLDLYIDKSSDVSKINELYENYLIDYGCIKYLVSWGIITEEDLKKYNLRIPKDDVYRQIQGQQEIKIHGATDIVPFSTTGAFIGAQIKNEETKLSNLYRILGNIEEENSGKFPIISHKNERGDQGFLDGYRICPLKPASLVAFLPPKSEPAKTTYIMPYQEIVFILQNKALPDFLLDNPAFRGVTPTEKMHEDILRIALQFEEAREYLTKLGYSEKLTFEQNMQTMITAYEKTRTKGEN